MKIKIFGFGLSQIDKETAEKICKNVLKQESTVIDIRHNEVGELNTNDILLIFGVRAQQLIKPLIAKKQITKHLMLAELSQLSNTENLELRKTTLVQLNEFKNILNSKSEDITVTKQSLSNLNPESIIEISKKKKEWIGILEDGRSIRLSDDKEIDSKYDINMTFAELVSLKLAMEHFNIKEFHLITEKK